MTEQNIKEEPNLKLDVLFKTKNGLKKAELLEGWIKWGGDVYHVKEDQVLEKIKFKDWLG